MLSMILKFNKKFLRQLIATSSYHNRLCIMNMTVAAIQISIGIQALSKVSRKGCVKLRKEKTAMQLSWHR